MNKDVPFTAHGDEVLEARIVAWVLGEASAFEAAELERLCDERPELMVFKRRIGVLNGMLQEAEVPQPDESWKLPPEKRKAVEKIFGEENPIRLEVAKERRIRHSGRRALLAIAACLALAFVTMYFQPWKKTSEAIIEVRPVSRGISPLGSRMTESAGKGAVTPQFFATEFEKIKSRNTLEKVVEKLDLANRWDMDKDQAVGKLQDSIDTKNVRGTDLVKIQVRQSDKTVADEIAREVAFAYKDYRQELEQQNAERQLAELNKAVRDQEDKVEERRKVLATIERTKQARANGQLAANDSREEAIKRGLDAQDYVDAKRDFETDQQLLQTMKLKQMGETISRRIPSDSVVIHEVPGSPAKSAETGSKSLASNSRTQRLETSFPKELIEGTPKPIILPEKTPSSRSLAMNEESRLVERKAKHDSDQKTAAPSASMAKVIAASGTAQPAAEPMPEVAANTASLDFGAADDFGAGWEDGKKQDDGKLVGNVEIVGGTRFSLDLPAGEKSRHPGATGLTGEREITYPSEFEPPEPPNAPGAVASPVTPATPTDMGFAGSDAPARTNPALTYEHAQNVDDVRRDLFKAEGNLNLGKFDEAKREYEDVLRTDPYNQAARRGMEKIAAAKSDYYRAAYDHTRAELLAQMDKSWDMEVPAEGNEINGFINYGAPVAKDVAKLPDDPEALAKGIRDQEDKVEERRKVLATIVRNKGVIYKGGELSKDEARDEVIKRGLDAQDYIDAKREFEQDQALLQHMKLKLMRAKAEASKPDLTQLMEEISAAEEPYSTFSLNISDASFRIAQAALAKGEQPDPAGIKVEQFYNAVDYGDPAPASNESVACAIEQAAHPVIPGRNLVRIALKTAAAGRSAAQPLRLTLLVDQSGSMTRADRRAAMDQALAGLAGLLTKDDVVNVIGFSRTPRLLADGMTGDQAAKLADLVNQSASEGGTNLEEAMKLADQLALRHKQPGAQNRIVLFTDGAANLGDADPERLAEKVKDLRQKGIAFDIAGIAADDLNDALLGELARNGNGRYYVVGKDDHDNFAKQLAGAFRPAAENVKVQVRFNPERVASYKLIGFEKDRLKTEDFRNDKVDAAELAAEEAGVAIYQVEPLAEGRGEIGEVSVRFRDTAVGEMVERAWTIPHDTAAPVLDRATPSMQLATLAMLAAEKLKGGPLGTAVDFKQFAEAQAEVKAHYSGEPRVAELLRMLEMLK